MEIDQSDPGLVALRFNRLRRMVPLRTLLPAWCAREANGDNKFKELWQVFDASLDLPYGAVMFSGLPSNHFDPPVCGNSDKERAEYRKLTGQKPWSAMYDRKWVPTHYTERVPYGVEQYRVPHDLSQLTIWREVTAILEREKARKKARGPSRRLVGAPG